MTKFQVLVLNPHLAKLTLTWATDSRQTSITFNKSKPSYYMYEILHILPSALSHYDPISNYKKKSKVANVQTTSRENQAQV